MAAAGNDGEDDDGDVESPGSVEDVICVGAVTRTSSIWSGVRKGTTMEDYGPTQFYPGRTQIRNRKSLRLVMKYQF